MNEYAEDNLVQKTTAEYLEKELGWESVYAYNNEDYGPGGLLGRDIFERIFAVLDEMYA